jgi:hypothetical protein
MTKYLVLLVCLSSLSFSWARKPAVEDFVGIENQDPEVIPQGTEALFNFDQQLDGHQNNKAVIKKVEYVKTKALEGHEYPIAGILGLLTLLALPVTSWYSAKKKYQKLAAVTPLDQFRNKTKEDQQDIKKAS